MEQCVNCKHWGDDEPDPTLPGMRECTRMLYATDLARSGEGVKDQLAVLVDDGGPGSVLYTHATFGCVLHEVKQ